MEIAKWLKRQAAAFSLAMSSLEKNALGQEGNGLGTNSAQEQRHTQGQLADSLVNGVITAEVEALRWRTYKVLRAAKLWTSEVVGHDKNVKPIIKQSQYDPSSSLAKVVIDKFDKYKLEMVIDNSSITIGAWGDMDDDNLILTDNPVIGKDKDGIEIATHGEIKNTERNINKNERPVLVHRDALPKFQIENYTTKLNVRIINETDRLLEFYISKYVDEDNRTTRLLISEIKKAINNPRSVNMLDLKEVGFITYKALGVVDFLEYQYKVLGFDKIVEFNGFYVIKFKAEVVVNGKDILEEYKNKELDIKYQNKESKNKKRK